MKWFLNKLLKFPLWYHLIFAAVLTCILLVCAFKWLESYTRHNEAVIVPDVKGLRMEQAAEFLKNSGLRYHIIDSVFSKEAAPGAVVDISPDGGSKVKEGRIIYVTLNALTAQMRNLPEVADLSVRQAYALLRAQGFESVETEYVDGQYKDLTIGVEMQGRRLNAGEMVPLSAPLVLIVSSGMETSFEEDSLDLLSQPVQPLEHEDENWF